MVAHSSALSSLWCPASVYFSCLPLLPLLLPSQSCSWQGGEPQFKAHMLALCSELVWKEVVQIHEATKMVNKERYVLNSSHIY